MHNDNNNIDTAFFAWSSILGALIGLGQILDSAEKLSWRIVVGRALVSAGLASMAPVLLVWLPQMPRMAEFAFAALVLVSLPLSRADLRAMMDRKNCHVRYIRAR